MNQTLPPRRLNEQTVQQPYWEALRTHLNFWRGCQNCPLGCQPEIIQKVFFKGTIPCHILFIGEAPGGSENATGYPFNNPKAAGWVFDRIVSDLVLLEPNLTWCVTNAVLCMPVNDDPKKPKEETRAPRHDELVACHNRLMEFIRICQPTILVPLGKVAQKAINLGVGPVATHGLATLSNPFGANQYRNPALRTVCRILPHAHPSWMQRDGQDTETEIKRVILSVVAEWRRLFLPIPKAL